VIRVIREGGGGGACEEEFDFGVDWCQIAAGVLGKKKLSQRDFVSLFGLLPCTINFIHRVYLVGTHLCDPKFILWTFSFSNTMRECQWVTGSFLQINGHSVTRCGR